MVHRSELLHASHFERHYQHLSPDSALADQVSHYFSLEGYHEIPQGVAEHLLPQLETRLILPLGNTCLYRQQAEPLLTISGPHLVAPQNRSLACLHPDSRRLLGIVFRPGGLTSLLGYAPQHAITALPELQSLESSLAAENDFSAQAAQLDRWLLSLRKDSDDSRLLSSALHRLESGIGVAEAASGVGLAPRSLQRHCQKLIGLSPRTCQRILRLRGTLTQLWAQPDYSVWDSPYYDYAHFFREFRSFTGLSPEAYLKQF